MLVNSVGPIPPLAKADAGSHPCTCTHRDPAPAAQQQLQHVGKMGIQGQNNTNSNQISRAACSLFSTLTEASHLKGTM